MFNERFLLLFSIISYIIFGHFVRTPLEETVAYLERETICLEFIGWFV